MTSTKLLITVLGIALPAFPQWTNTIAMRGGVPGAAYDISGIENINMLNGNLFLKIPITALPGGHGGSSLDLNLIYNSTLFDEAHSVDSSGYTTDALVPGFYNGWNYGFRYDIGQETQGADGPGGNCAPVNGVSNPAHFQIYPTRIRALFPDGSTHILYPASSLGEDTSGGGGWTEIDPGGNLSQCAQQQGGATSLSGPITYYTRDATYVRVVFYPINGSAPDPSWFNRSWTMYFPDGRQVQSTPTATVNETILDRNGNKIMISNSDPCHGTGTSCPIATISDSFNRTITINFRNPTNLTTETITQNGFDGAQLVWTITYTTAGTAGFTYGCSLNPDTPACTIGPQVAISELDLPGFSTTLSYLFQYPTNSSDARLTGVTLPYGAQANYQYSSSPPIGAFGNLINNPLYKKTLTYQDPLTSSPITDTWTYGIVFGSGSSTVMGPDGGTTTQLYSDIISGSTPSGSGAFSGTAAAGFTYATINPDGSRDEKLWAANLTANSSVELGNPFVQAEIHSVSASGSAVNSAFSYHTFDFNGNLLQTRQSDWHGSYCGLSCFSSGFAAARTTTNTYWVDASLTANQYNSLSSACPAQTACLLDAVKSTQVADSALQTYVEFVYDSPTSTGNLQSEWHWDNSRPAPNSPFPGQAPTGSSTTNLTLNATNAVLTSRTYSNGDLVTEIDPRSIERKYLYNDPSNPYPTDLYEAFGTAVQRHWQFVWDASSGLRKSEQDADNDPSGAALTRANYDARGRILQVNQSGLRLTTTSYNDLPTVRTVTTKTDLATVNDGSIQTVKTMDQLGRLAEVQQTDDNGGWIETDYSQQINSGFTYQVASNPFRSKTSDTTMGWTVTKLDNIGRPMSVTHYIGPNLPAPWGTGAGTNTSTTGSVVTQYSGNTTTVTDEENKARASTVDSFGRLVQVVEDPNGTPLTTTYNYGLGDLMGVLQSVQSRTFGYTSLNRLSSAQNPENGNITYTYDLDGNLGSRTDARTISTNMQYDSLNRITSKSYMDGGITPAVTYCYDGQTYSTTLGGCTTGTPIAPNIGRLTDEYSSASETLFTYDILGEALSSTQKTNGVTYSAFGYLYNRAGSLKQQTYPSGRIVNYSFNTGGRVSQVSGTFNSSPTTYASSISYAPQFGLSGLTLGNNLTEAYSYNGRLQNTQIVVGSFLTLTNCFDSYQAIPGSPCASVTNLTTANNGNLMDEIINGSSVITQTFTYGDGENRLTLFQETGGSQANQTYNYDVFGNRWLNLGDFIPYLGQTPTSNVFLGNHWGWSSGMNCTSQTSNVPDVQYDCSGNQTKLVAEGRTFTYDAENRQITATVGTVGTSYAYDGEGRRVTKTVGTVTTTYVYDAAGNLAAEYNGPAPTNPGTIYLTPDHLGSTRLISNGTIVNNVMTPQVVERLDYAPFGEELGQGIDGRGTQYSNNSYPTATLDSATEKFTTKERDAETGLDWFETRYFSSAQGRFTSPDAPFAGQHKEDPQSWNMYSYVRNNPLRYTDPDGRDCSGGVVACLNTIAGSVGQVVNTFSSDIINAPNRILDTVLSLTPTSFRFGDAVPAAFTPANSDQQEGANAVKNTLIAAPVIGALGSVGAAGSIAEAGVAGAVEEGAAATGGRLGSAATRAQNSAIADSLESRGFTVTGGGGRLPEEYIPGPGGARQGSTYVDVTATRDGRTVRVQTVDTKADGVTPTTREANAAARIRAQQQPRDHTVLIPKKPNEQ